MELANALLAIGVGVAAASLVLLLVRGRKPRVISLSNSPQISTSNRVRVVAKPIGTLTSSGEPASLTGDWPAEMLLHYPGATQLNRVSTTLSWSIRLQNQAQGSPAASAQKTITLVSDAAPDRILAWYGEQLTSLGWQPADDSGEVEPDGSPTARRYVKNDAELQIAVDDPARARESLESFQNILKDGSVQDQLKKIVGADPAMAEALQRLPSIDGKTIFELRYSKKSDG